jgi:hypothetical protein
MPELSIRQIHHRHVLGKDLAFHSPGLERIDTS